MLATKRRGGHATLEGRQRAERIQAFLLEEYERCGNRDDALWSLVELHAQDLEGYKKIVGHDKVITAETLRSEYWRRIDPETREAALDRYLPV